MFLQPFMQLLYGESFCVSGLSTENGEVWDFRSTVRLLWVKVLSPALLYSAVIGCVVGCVVGCAVGCAVMPCIDLRSCTRSN